MAKQTSKFVCQQCGYEQVGWAGRCPNCGEWNSLVETVVSQSSAIGGRPKSGTANTSSSKSIKLSEIKANSTTRILTKISELDRVLGGGLVSGQVILIAGEPGIGKSTLLLQLASKLSAVSSQSSVLYASGEESAIQIKIRADRLGVKSKKIELLEETNIDNIINTGSQLSAVSGRSSAVSGQPSVSDKKPKTENRHPTALIVDSIQTMHTDDLTGMSGSVGQVRECTYRLVNFAKRTGTIVFIVGHVTKQGSVAGPSVLAHLVDTVLWFEGDQNNILRVLRSFKNRFGPTDEVGIFSMQEAGLVSEGDPEKLFLTGDKHRASGSITSSVLQGTRPILIEIQSLVVPTKMAFPKRNAQGIDPRRFEMLVAVLTRRAGLPLYDWDVLVNVAGGIKAYDPAVDLAVCLSVASAFYDKILPSKLLAIGEVGLLGEIRPAPMEEKRTKEARRLGYSNIVSTKNFKYLSEAIKKYLK